MIHSQNFLVCSYFCSFFFLWPYWNAIVFVMVSFLFPHPVTPAGVSAFLCLVGSSPVLRSVLMWIAGTGGNPAHKTLFNFYQTPYCLLLIPLWFLLCIVFYIVVWMHNLRPVLEFFSFLLIFYFYNIKSKENMEPARM